MAVLYIDIETYSSVALDKSGVYKYAQAPDFTVLLFGYSLNGAPAQVIDLTAEPLPAVLIKAILNPKILKTAHNANFERVCLSSYLGEALAPEDWECTMVRATQSGLPGSLANVAQVLKLPVQKVKEGKALIRLFCMPAKKGPTPTREDLPAKWAEFTDYCRLDVEVEIAIRKALEGVAESPTEREVYILDQKINGQGLLLDRALIDAAVSLSDTNKGVLMAEGHELTGMDNPGSAAQIKKWLGARSGGPAPTSLTKGDVVDMLEAEDGSDPELTRMLTIRQELSKTSVAKYDAMKMAIGSDDRARGLFQFNGAGRTGRWCLAKGTWLLVKTVKGTVCQKPIQRIEITDMLWDGDDWVSHEGRVFSGYKFVMYWDGVWATPSHKVYISDNEMVHLADAERRRAPIWGGNHRIEGLRFSEPLLSADGKCRTYDIINAGPKNRFMANGRIVSNSGRLIQMQNLPHNKLRDLDLARSVVRSGDMELLDMMYGNVPDTLSQLLRTAFIAPRGSRLLVSDFSAIEARVIAWLAGEKWRMEVFAGDGKIYEASAAQMFKVPIESITKGSPLRAKGKISELACGFGGGVDALIRMGALKMGLRKEELRGLIRAWRAANPQIVKLWRTVEDAAFEAVDGRTVVLAHGLRFFRQGPRLFIELPSGRRLAYYNPTIGPGTKPGSSQIMFEGTDPITHKWVSISTWGGKLVENVVQGIARDCLAEAMLRLDKAGYNIVCHVHDEIIAEMPEGRGSVEEMTKIMGEAISWAEGLPLGAESFETIYYKKD